MPRELNREIFGNRLGFDDQVSMPTPTPPGAKAEEVRVLHLHIETLSKRLKEFESRVEKMHTKVEEVVTQNRQRFERVQATFKNQTEMLQSAMSDVHNKIAQVVSRLNERKISEGVVKEMVDRHGQVVQAFETRLQQFQKVMSDQELQLMHARSELKTALHELERLKKGT
jgi:dsDNA-specific endonuclease/ATPase MutS2